VLFSSASTLLRVPLFLLALLVVRGLPAHHLAAVAAIVRRRPAQAREYMRSVGYPLTGWPS
jgi:DNA-binding GntR family transcriptional regulator